MAAYGPPALYHTETMTVVLTDGALTLRVNLGSKFPVAGVFARVPQYVDHGLIPPFLMAERAIGVYADSDETEAYFRDTVVTAAVTMGQPYGLLFEPTFLSRSALAPTAGAAHSVGTKTRLRYLVFTTTDANQLQCFIIDFSLLGRVLSIPFIDSTGEISLLEADLLAFAAGASTGAVRAPSLSKTASNVSIFDKVLSKRKQNLFVMPPSQLAVHSASQTALSLQILSTNEQISQAVSKLVLSGLRLRGLSGFLHHSTQTSNEKLAVREIYQMTQKCALFAVRKYNYGFNRPSSPHGADLSPQPLVVPVHMNDVQDIVENLLLVFIDMDELETS